jgi:nitrile hydratase
LERHGFATWRELLTGIPEKTAEPVSDILRPDMVDDMLATGPSELVISDKPRFSLGDRVTTRNFHLQTHTRLPRYARGKEGVVEAIGGTYTFADDNAHGKGPSPQWLYTVVFDGLELWGSGSNGNIKVSIDAWESYLEPA